jgi:hypothetical protein
MRTFQIIALGGLFIPPFLFAQYRDLAAQGQFCATYNDNAPEDCSFSTMQMCEQSVSGAGGSCAPQASAPVMPPGPPAAPLFPLRPDPYAFAPAPVPPPPTGNAPAIPSATIADESHRSTEGHGNLHQEATDMHLEDVGFTMRLAEPQQLGRLRSLPPRKFIARTIGGQRYYLYADPDLCKCVFLGNESAMQSYKDLVSPPAALPGELVGRPSGSLSIEEMDPDLSSSIVSGDILDYRF